MNKEITHVTGSFSLQENFPTEIPKGIRMHDGKYLISVSELKEVVQLLQEYKNFFDRDFQIKEQYLTIVENKNS